MKNACLFVHCISRFKVTSYKKKYKTELVYQPVLLFRVVLHHISFYISRYHYNFLNFLEPNPTFSKKRFSSPIFFLTNSPQPSTPLNSQNLLSVTKAFYWGSLNLEHLRIYIWFMVVWFLISWHKWIYITFYPYPWIKIYSVMLRKVNVYG